MVRLSIAKPIVQKMDRAEGGCVGKDRHCAEHREPTMMMNDEQLEAGERPRNRMVWEMNVGS